MTSTGWGPRVAFAAVCAMAVAGCGQRGAGPPIAPTTWQEPASYTYTVDSRCGERLLIGRIRMWVSQGTVVRANGLDEPGKAVASQAKAANLPTLGQLLDEYETSRRGGADVATVAFDPGDGHPTKIDLDPLANAIDDEACYVISDYAVVPAPSAS